MALVVGFAGFAGCKTASTGSTLRDDQAATGDTTVPDVNADDSTEALDQFEDAPQANQEVVKRARSNDNADRYQLDVSGNFWRYMRDTLKKCQITTNVVDFKVSAHPDDAAMIYFVRAENGVNNLYILTNGSDGFGDCPKQNKSVIARDLKRVGGHYMYHVVPTNQTTIVNTALSNDGTFNAWGNTGSPLVSEQNITDYSLNACFGQQGRSFSTYVAFIINSNGWVKKVKGNAPDQSKWDQSKTYTDVQDFKAQNNVCN